MKSARPDYYQALGVERGADAGEIKAAYRRLAFAHHPDRNPGDAGAEEKFKEVSVAYAVLGDEDKREKYDRFGSLAGDLPLGADADLRTVLDFFDAVFGDLFGTARKRPAGQDLRYTLELSFAELALGCEKEITFTRSGDCARCRGTGAEGGAAGLAPCPRCAGQGTLKQKAGIFTARRECPTCNGVGQVARESCPACAGAGLTDVERRFTVRIPAGSQQGKSQRVPGEGAPSRPGGIAGDLHVIVRVQPDPIYKQEGDVLICELPLSLSELALGVEVDIPLLDACVRMKIPAGTQPGSMFRVRGKGLPLPGGRGDAHVRVRVEVPSEVSPAASALLSQLEQVLGEDAYPERKAFRARATAIADGSRTTSDGSRATSHGSRATSDGSRTTSDG
ncbi:MAG: J domain-containing protein [Polyangia bacterium]|jgi:molecular chaperone DnaJ